MLYIEVHTEQYLLAMGTKNGANASFSVQGKIFPKLKVQILQMRYQNVPLLCRGKKLWNFQSVIMFSSFKNSNFFKE